MSAIPRLPCPSDRPRRPHGLYDSATPTARPVTRGEKPPEGPPRRRERTLLHLAYGCIEEGDGDPYPPRWSRYPRPTYLHRCPCCHATRADPSVKTWTCPRCAEIGDDVPMEVVVMYCD